MATNNRSLFRNMSKVNRDMLVKMSNAVLSVRPLPQPKLMAKKGA